MLNPQYFQDLLLAYVAGGQLYLRQIDFSASLSAPTITDIPGPTGASLNVGSSCMVSHPEIAVIDGAIDVVWAESCTSGSYSLQMRSLQ
jgi:hypothetical protein